MREQVRNFFMALLLLALLPLLGCGSSSGGNSTGDTPPLNGGGTSYTVEVTDQLGRTVKLEKLPQRIISLDPGNTELLYTLGVGDKVVAVTDYCDYPDEAKEKPKVSGYNGVDMEKLVGFSPDLVLVTASQEINIIPELERRGITAFGLNPHNLEEVFSGITLVGEITGQQEEASQIVSDMRDNIEEIVARTEAIPYDERPFVFYVYWHEPLITAGSGTLEDEMIEKAGGKNIAHGLNGYEEVTAAEVAEANPDVIFVRMDFTMWLGADLPYEYVTSDWELSNTNALTSGRVYQIWDVLLKRPGPRLVNGLDELYQLMQWVPSQ